MTTENAIELLERIEQDLFGMGLDTEWSPKHLNTSHLIFIAQMLGQTNALIATVRAMLVGEEEMSNMSNLNYVHDRIERILTAIKLSKEV